MYESIRDILLIVKISFGDRVRFVWEEFENQNTVEAKFASPEVKDLLDMVKEDLKKQFAATGVAWVAGELKT